MEVLDRSVNPFELRNLVRRVVSLSHFHGVPPPVRVNPLGQALLALGFEAAEIHQKIGLRPFHAKKREKPLDRRHGGLVVQAPGHESPVVRPSSLPYGQAATEGFRQEFDGARWHDLSATDVDPVMWAEHTLSLSLLDSEASIAVHDTSQISESLASRPA